MPLYDDFPYTNFHALNLDWIVRKLSELEKGESSDEQSSTTTLANNLAGNYPYTNFHALNLDWIVRSMLELEHEWDSISDNITASAHFSLNPTAEVTGSLQDGLNFDFGLPVGPEGPAGPQGIQGETGAGIEILDRYATLADLQAAHPTGNPGDAYMVGDHLYIWSVSTSAWIDAGTLSSPSPSVTVPLMDGTAAIGSLTAYAKADHRHPTDTSRASDAEMNALIRNSQTLIDQGFRYRNSPAIQDGIAKIDSIKGNTIIKNGTLISFNGTGLKTTGKNLCPKFTNGTGANLTYTIGDDGSVKVTGTNTGTAFYAVQFTLPAGTYVLSGAPTNGQLTIRNAQGGDAPSSEFSGQLDDYGNGATFTVSATATAWLNIRSTARVHDDTYYPMIRFADTDDTYEPYTSSTLSLPISTYFPNGMKSAGTVYDELTPRKAITRIGVVDLGTLTWVLVNSEYWQCRTGVSDMKLPTNNVDPSNVKHSNYATVGGYYVQSANQIGIVSNGYINCNNGSTTDKPSGYLYYELVTPVETSVDLDLDFMAYENGTEQLLPTDESVTSPIIADITYLSVDAMLEDILDQLGNIPGTIEQELQGLDDRVSDVEADITTIEGNVSSNTGRITTLETGLANTNGQMQNLNTSLGNTQTQLTALDDYIDDATSRTLTLGGLTGSLVISSGSKSVTLTAGQSMTVSVPSSFVPSGYTPLFAIGFQSGSSEVCITGFEPYVNGSGNFKVGVKSLYSSASTTTQVSVTFLCAKNR